MGKHKPDPQPVRVSFQSLNLAAALEKILAELPDGWIVRLECYAVGWLVQLYDPAGAAVPLTYVHSDPANQIREAVNYARARSQKGNRRRD